MSTFSHGRIARVALMHPFFMRTMPTREPRAACAQENNLVQILTEDVEAASRSSSGASALLPDKHRLPGQGIVPVPIFSILIGKAGNFSACRRDVVPPNRSFTIDGIAACKTARSPKSKPKFIGSRLLLSIP
ncbi:MAG: hypothetical protein J0I86_10475 [Mesorhizobium sp.]|nr:hypothetical protein [Mesorhizobium sp.]